MKKGFSKEAQFFLLTAVIISAIVISLGITANQAIISSNPEHIYDYTFNVKKETGAVVDYEIYTDFENNVNLENFVGIIAEDMRDRDPALNFLFIYGDTNKTVIKNYGSQNAEVIMGMDGEIIEGGGFKITSSIKLDDGTYTEVEETLKEYGKGTWNKTYINLPDKSFVDVRIKDYSFPFLVSKYKQVIFITQKDERNGTYVAVE
jgi:hypothetical protein